jgi:hypothetical protein
MIKQMITIKARYTNYEKFSMAAITDILTKEELEKSLKLSANTFSSCFIKNNGNGKFEISALPVQAQLSSVFAMIADDLDGDNKLDIVINGNDYGAEIGTGRYDAFNGLVLKGDGKGNFTPLAAQQSGLYIPGDGKSLGMILSADSRLLILATQNQGPLQIFQKQMPDKIIRVDPGDVSVEYLLSDDKKRKQELYYGDSFYSQSGRYIIAGQGVKAVSITDRAGKRRSINF